MAVRSCRVTVTDLEGISHSVEVTASTLYEAVALGLAALRDAEWVAGIPEGLGTRPRDGDEHPGRTHRQDS